MTPLERRDIVYGTLLECLPAYGFPLIDPLVPLAQSAHETGDFASPLAVQFNNVYGMKVPSQRPFNGHGSGVWEGGKEFAAYDSVQDSVEDYLERQRYFSIDGSSNAAFIADTINSGYATDPNYAVVWNNWIAQLEGVDFPDPWYANDPMHDPSGVQSASMVPLLILGLLILSGKGMFR